MKWNLFILLFICFSFSCVTTKDFDELKSEMETVKKANKDMEIVLKEFMEKYDSNLRFELESNMAKVESDIQKLGVIRNKATQDGNTIAQYLESAKNDKDQTERNRMESNTQNVVNEFRELKNLWEDTRKILMIYSDEAQKAATSADVQAKSAYKSVLEAEAKLYRIETLSRTLNDWIGRFTEIGNEVDKVEKDLNTNEKNISIINNSINSINIRIASLEKNTVNIDNLNKQLEKIDQILSQLLKQLNTNEKVK
jgi:chromosome segregation ATPase